MKKKIVAIFCAIVVLIGALATVLLLAINNEETSYHLVATNTNFSGKVNQWSKTLGTVKRNIPTETKNEGLNARYPTYGTSLTNITDEEKDNLIAEDKLLRVSNSTYDMMDSEGNLYLNGTAIGRKLYKHTASENMYYGDVSDDEKAVIEQITITANEQRNYVTGLYAPAGEIVKIEISEEDLQAIGGELLVVVGQVSHRNNENNIWKARDDFKRMPVVANQFKITSTTAYVGNFLGGPIYLYPKTFGKTFTTTISGAVKYFHYIHGQTTKQEVQEMKNYSAPYYDFEVWDLGVRHSGPKLYASYDYDNLVKCGDLWEKIIRTSRQVPCSANSTIGVCYVYDCFVAAGEACAFQGGHSWINAPCYWLSGALNYDAMVTNGFWGVIHEYNHLYQSYGMESGKTNEVTNNATSLLSYVLYTKISEKRSCDDSTLGGDWNRFTDPSRSLRETLSFYEKGESTKALNAYADILHTFGTDIFAKATRLQKKYGTDGWYEALSLATDYNFTYYFEKVLGQTLSDDVKALYDTEDRIVFVPIATVFQVGRSFYDGGEEVFTKTVQPYCISRGESVEINFNERLILPKDFTYEIKSVSSPKSGTITKISNNVYKYTPGKDEYSGEIKIDVELASETYETRNVTLVLNFKQYDKNQVSQTKYTFAGDTKYASVKEAVANNFAGYTNKQEKTNTTTFMNGIANAEIGIVEGKIYIAQDGEYAVCLRSGRGNNTLYLAVNDEKSLKEVLSLDTNHVSFSLSGEHVVNLNLKKGDYVCFREITLSRGSADAFTELGIANLNESGATMKTVATNVLYMFGGTRDEREFVSEEKYAREYTESVEVSCSGSSLHELVSVNMDSWDSAQGAENIFNSDIDSYYHNNRNNFVSEDNPFILIADAKNTDYFNTIKITSRTSGQYNLPSTFKLYVSKDCKTWELAGEFENLSLTGNSVVATFAEKEFRYYKLYVTDTKSQSSGNKYVTIASIELSDTFSGREISPNELEFYESKNQGFTEERTISTFGTIVKGDGKVTFSFSGTGIALMVRQDQTAKIRIKIDGNYYTAEINANNSKQLAFIARHFEDKKHELEIVVLSGKLCLDSVIIK